MVHVNPASLLEQKFHTPALLDLVSRKPNLFVYDYFVRKTIRLAEDIIQSSESRRTIPHVESFRTFAVSFFTSSSRVGMNVILTALVLMHRIDKRALRLYIESELEMQLCHLIFLASILVAIKSVDDYSRPIKLFLRCCAGLVTESQLISYETEFLKLIDYRLTFSETELVKYYNDIKACYDHHPPIRDYTQKYQAPETTDHSKCRSHRPKTRPRTISQPTYVQCPQAVRPHVDISHGMKKRPDTPYNIEIPTPNSADQHSRLSHAGKRHREMSTRVPKLHGPRRTHTDYSKTQMPMQSTPYPSPLSQNPSPYQPKPLPFQPHAKPVIPQEPYIPTLHRASRSATQLTLRHKDGGLASKIKNALKLGK